MFLVFLLYTIVFWASGSAIIKLFFKAIQRGQLLDQLFGWADMLERLYASDRRWKNNLGKALGDCQMCTSFWFTFLWFWVYYFFSRNVLHYFITDEVNSFILKIAVFIVWIIAFNSLSTTIGLFILQLKTKKK